MLKDLFDEYTNLVYIIDRGLTMKGTKLIFIAIFVSVIGIISCAQSPTSSIESVDKPSLSSKQAISIAKREAKADCTWAFSEDMATVYTSRSEGWTAEYTGNGVWEVKFRLPISEGWVHKYIWRVFELDRTAKYIAGYKHPTYNLGN